MPQSNSNDFRKIARQARETAVRLSEDNYQTAMREAAATRDEAIRNADAAKTETVNAARQMIEQARKRLDEARDRIEVGLRKQEFAEVQRNQEWAVVKAEEKRIKAIKQAEETAKRTALEAAERRRLAIQQADTTEKKALLEARELIKSNREAERARSKRERNESRTAIKQTIEIVASAKKDADLERELQKSSKKAKLKSEPLSEAPPSDAGASELSELAAKPATLATKEPPKTSGEPLPPVVKRSGTIKLVISNEDGVAENLSEFETGLRNIPGIHLLMVGGTVKEGLQITLKADNDMALSGMLRLFPTVECATDRPGNILIKLKQAIKA